MDEKITKNKNPVNRTVCAKKRSEGFFGLHFDFHAGADCAEVGKTVSEEMIREVVEMMRPDYIQCDCKGHAGYSSYPTKVGNPAPGFVADQLKIWRKVTKEFNIPLVMHYSGVWDTRALELHPEWAAVGDDGAPSTKMTSTFKGYADGLLIPQLVELANEYGVDAAWVDGECWATVPDFDAGVIASFEAESGMKLSKSAEEKYDRRSAEYRAFLDFCRERFFAYLAHYTDEVHRKTNGFEIASNWAFSSHIPQPVRAGVDFLSGDFAPTDSYNSARFEARVLCVQGKPWDLMAWGFYYDFTPKSVHSPKGADALCREAAAVLSLGGGFQIYNTQNRDGSVRLRELRALRGVADFVREREPFVRGATPFSESGILYSDFDMRRKCDSLFYPGGNETVRGAVRLALDSARTCEVLMDHTLTPERLAEMRVVILPELEFVGDEIRRVLLRFVENGGALILSGYECCKAFADVLGATISDGFGERKIIVRDGEREIHQFAKTADAVALAGCEVMRDCAADGLETTERKPIVTKAKFGAGTITAIHYNVFGLYHDAPDFHVRDMVSGIIDGVCAERFVEYTGPKFADIVTTRKDGNIFVHLTNTSGIYSESRLRTYDEVQALTDIELRVKVSKEPRSVKLLPDGVIPEHHYNSATQRLTVRIARLHIHAAVQIETNP